MSDILKDSIGRYFGFVNFDDYSDSVKSIIDARENSAIGWFLINEKANGRDWEKLPAQKLKMKVRAFRSLHGL